jgi:hypothetical protein
MFSAERAPAATDVMKNTRFPQSPKSINTRRTRFLLGAVLGGLAAAGGLLQAQPISVPNFSFESPAAPNTYPFVNTSVDSWQKAPEPAYYGPAIGIPYGIPWVGTAGLFLDVNPYVNHDGLQCGYILGFPQVTLFQDYSTSPTHDFNASFDVGKAYNLTIGVFGKSTLAPGSTLELSLYYLDPSGNHVVVDSTTVTYSAAAFPLTAPLNLVNYQVNVPAVQPGDAWAGKNIGIQLESTTPLTMATGGNWDFDNVRLTAVVPEPGSLSLAGAGLGCLMLARRRARRRG